jgi:hypothetical protein
LAHLRGARRIIECNGVEIYSEATDSVPRSLAEYVRGMDAIRAVSQQEECMFGNDEWDSLGKPEKVCSFNSADDSQLISSLASTARSRM